MEECSNSQFFTQRCCCLRLQQGATWDPNISISGTAKAASIQLTRLQSWRASGTWHGSTDLPFPSAVCTAVFSTYLLITHISCTSVTYRNQRDFSHHPLHKLFLNIFTCLIKNRLVSRYLYCLCSTFLSNIFQMRKADNKTGREWKSID